jgi:hypothetical protein
VTKQDLGNVDQKHGQVSRIVNRGLVNIHKIFQPPELFVITEIELDLATSTMLTLFGFEPLMLKT